jgi:hypothetical protein
VSSVSATQPRLGYLNDRLPLTWVAAVSLVAAALGATWLLSDVTAWEAVRFVLYEAGFTVLPGCLLYMALTPAPGGWLRTLAIGWPCGYALEVGCYAATAALDARWAFALLPLIAILVVGPIAYRRTLARRAASTRAGGARVGAERSDGWDALLVAIAAALILLAFIFFSPAPLPGHAHSVFYSVDNVFDISLAAEARHHWPLTEPWVAGQALHYYTGSFVHMAAINQVTGIPLASVVLRLFPSVMFLVVALQLWSLGGGIGKSRWVGPLAVALMLGVEDINLDPSHIEVLHVNPFTQFSLSPSFAFGAPFLLGLLAIVQSWLPSGQLADGSSRSWSTPSSPGARGSLALMALLAFACGAAKAFAVADVIGGLAVFWLWCALTGRPARLLAYGTSVAFVGGVLVYLLMLRGGTAGTLGVHPLDFLTSADTLTRARTALQSVVGHSFVWILALVLAAPLVATLVFAPLLGALWLLRRREALSPFVVLCICMFLVGLLAYVTLGAPGGVEGVFLVYGYIALMPVAALGLVSLWAEIPSGLRRGAARSCALVFVLALALALVGSTLGSPKSGLVRDAWYAFAYGLVGAVALAVVVRRARLYRLTIASAPARVVACVLPLLVVLGAVKPVTLSAVGAAKTVLHRRIAQTDSPTTYGITAALYQGLLWVRAHTTSCDVLAVNNHYEGPPPALSNYFYYSAFAERRVFLESWHYTPRSALVAQPFPARYALNTEALQHGSASALRRLGQDGVSYVLIDKLHGGGAPEPPSVSRLVFENSALDVYRLSSTRRAGGCS